MNNQLRIPVVEDEELIATSISHFLKDLDAMALEPVPKGEMSVDVGLRERPDLILMDIRLAGSMDGIEAARHIRKRHPIPIVFLSAVLSGYIKQKAADVEYQAFLGKPVSLKQLESVISETKFRLRSRRNGIIAAALPMGKKRKSNN